MCLNDPEVRLLKQISNAEDEKKIHCFISIPTAYYEIEYGLVKGGAGKGILPSFLNRSKKEVQYDVIIVRFSIRFHSDSQIIAVL